ncbi:MMPL family transporter [Embleya sp. MST-111070]|uniref:MMPL family transporter n=1 Tax=Embleya sp. MST-111070 TaxID=3398231 RepID=UPI003F73DC63
MATTRAAIQPPASPGPSATPGWTRYARVVAGRRSKWAVLAIWVLLIAVGGSLAAKIGSVQDNDPQTWLPADAQSTKAMDIGEKHFADKNVATAVVVYARESGLSATDLAKVDRDRAALAAEGAAAPVPAPVVAEDRRAAFLSVALRTSKNDNAVLGDGVDKLRDLARTDAPAGLDVRITGRAGNIADFIDVYSGLDLALLGATLGLVALLLLITYRSPILWLIPLLSVALGAQVANGVVYLLARHAGLLVNGQSAYVLTVLVLGVGTDYALLLVARYREELRRHEDRHEAMVQALTRCLPAIVASALTVIVATLCLVFGSMNSTRGLGPVVAVGVAVVSLAMTSLLPALLVILGRWAFWPFVPRYTPDAPAEPVAAERARGLWPAVARLVGRAPRALWIGTAVVLAALALGATAASTGQTQAEQFTKKVDSVTGQQLLARHFAAGSAAPADVYVPSAVGGDAAAMIRGVPGVAAARVDRTAGGWAHIGAVLADAPDTGAARRTVDHIRITLDHAPGRVSEAVVGGQSAVALDTSNAQGREEKLLIPLVLAIVLIMLVVLLRALVAPIVLLLSVVLSYAAAVGAAVLVFRALGHPRIDRGLLLFGFLFLVALGIDYTVFLMTRAREEVRLRGHREGMLTALTVTGGVITSAGLVLAATFAALTVIPTVTSLQQGLLVAIGVLLDTLLVRSLLVPALALDIGPRIWRPGHPERPSPRPTP